MKRLTAAIALTIGIHSAVAQGAAGKPVASEDSSLARDADMQFGGYLRSGKEVRFILIAVADQKTSPFLKFGDTFRGHKIVGFDVSREVITIEIADRTTELPLRSASNTDGDAVPSIAVRLHFDLRADGSITVDGLQFDRNNLAAHVLKFARSGDTIEIRLRVPRGIAPKLVNHTLNDLVKPTAMAGIRLKWTPEVVEP